MKKQVLTFFGFMAVYTSAIAQDNKTGIIPCNTYNAMEDVFQADPNARLRYNLVQSQLALDYQQAIQEQSSKKIATPIYTVPVVFHILHQNGSENVSDAAIVSALSQVNKDYSKSGSDISTINSNFSSLYVDAQIRFELAKKDPNGNCTNGIIHHLDANTIWDKNNTFAYAYSGLGTNRWPTNKYLNIYIVKCIVSSSSTCPASGGVVVGYTYLPGTWGTNSAPDAIVYRSDYLNGIESRALSHEIGHWLNLMHTFGSTNNPGVSCSDDGITDTPVTKGYYSTCPGNNAGPFTGCSSNENIENFMDYSSCPKMFTQGQITQMRSALTSGSGGRNNICANANLLATGIAGNYTCTPLADFTANKLYNCANNPVNFTNQSQLGNSGSLLWSFQGGNPATSTSTAPSITYASPGTYSVSLKATNSNGTNTKTKISYITIINGSGGVTVPYLIDFESGVPSSVNVINNNAGTIAWASTSTGANSTSKSIFLNNASQSGGGQTDIFETPFYNFTNTSAISLSYYYAYAKKTSSQIDSFKVQYSLDCGGSWTNILGVSNPATMATNSGGTTSTSFMPSASQWKQITISSALLTALTNKPSVKFRFYFKSDAAVGSSNNIYIDQINLSGTVGLTDLENSLGLLIYPNPTNASSTIDFNIDNTENIKISVMDIVGRVVEETDKPSINGRNVKYIVNKNGDLAKGIYIINLDVNNQRLSKKLVIE